jgi:hypothetical protein
MRDFEQEKTKEEGLNDLLRAVIERLNSQSAAIDLLTTTVKKIEGSTAKMQVQPKPNIVVDTKPVEDILKNGFSEIKTHIDLQPKALVKKFRILLFPEQDAKLFYKIVFSRWFMWLAIMFFCLHLYKWAVYRENLQKEITVEAMKTHHIIRAWDYLYDLKNKPLHKLMDSALVKTVEK